MSYGDCPTFDYERAWDEVAKPGFDGLSADMRALYWRTCEVARELSQKPDLSMPWPSEEDAPGFRQSFRNMPAEELSHAARVVYCFGHWAWRHEPGEDRTGGHWKFAHYADQELRARLQLNARDLPPEPDFSMRGNGVGVSLHEGWLRLCLSTVDGWTWHEVGPATARNLERARHVAALILTPRDTQRRSREAWGVTWDQFERTKHLAEWLCIGDDPRAQRWAHVAERYMIRNSELTKRHDDRRAAKRAAEEARKDAECARCCAL